MRYGFVIDMQRCIGCHTCSVACRTENNLPEGVWWNRTLTEGGDEMDTPSGEFPDVAMSYYTVACQHCSKPACADVCPVGATYKDEETGIVHQDYSKCIGCQMCISACPYEGVRHFNDGEPTWALDFAMGDPDVPAHRANVVEKCTMCAHRVARDEEPMCVKVCPTRARFWGDLDDPESEVSKLIAEREYKQLLAEEGTEPNVYYLV